MASLRIYETKRGPMYRGHWRVGEKQKSRTLGRAWVERAGDEWRRKRGRPPAGVLSESEAWEQVEKLEAADRGLKAGPGTVEGVAAAWVAYLAATGRATPATLRGHRSDLRRINRRWGQVSPMSLDEGEIEEWLDDMEVSPRTRNKYRQTFSSVIGFAVRKGWCHDNPVRRVEKLPEGRPKPVPTFTPEELDLIVRTAYRGSHRTPRDVRGGGRTPEQMQWENQRDAVMYLTAAQTGLRQGELTALCWRHIDLKKQTLLVEQAFSNKQLSTTKGKDYRNVPITPPLKQALQAFRRHRLTRSDWVFANLLGAPQDVSAVRKRFLATLKAAKLPHRRFHDLRHTFGSRAVEQFTIVDVRDMMGHASLATTERYLHGRSRTDDADRLAKAFER